MTDKELEEGNLTKKQAEDILTGQLELFEGIYTGSQSPPVRSDIMTAQYPLFSLSTREKDMDARYFVTKDGKSLEAHPSGYGLPNMDDKGLLVYAVSQLAQAQELEKLQPKHVIKIHTADLYRATTGEDPADPENKKAYGSFNQTLKKRLLRLTGSTLVGEIKISGEPYDLGGVRWVEGFVLPRKAAGRQGVLYMVLSDMMIKFVADNFFHVYHPLYFTLKKPLHRRLYEIARFSVRYSKEKFYTYDFLYQASGSKCKTLKIFIKGVRNLIATEGVDGRLSLLDYVAVDAGEGINFVRTSKFLANKEQAEYMEYIRDPDEDEEDLK